ncbi:hypothetical protein C8F01DRAFT_1049200 [Mycena amicta]|nr:hypothetical protein C8F01DRAFT_1049200 [Mycena amicta]
MSTDERPAKRRKQEDHNEEAKVTTFDRSADHWFDDGSLILHVESTEFRVHKSVLATHSSVFRDMFMIPLPADEPLVHNCSVVVLSDKSKDWTHLLSVMYPQGCFREVKPTVDQISAVLRLSKKYDIPSFRKECVRRVKGEFPTTLKKFESNREAWSLIRTQAVGDASSGVSHSIQIVNLAREVGLYSVLPSALYDIIFLHLVPTEPGGIMDNETRLNPEDRLACLQGYIRLTLSKSPMEFLLPEKAKANVPCDRCVQRGTCESSLKGTLLKLAREPTTVTALDSWENRWARGLCDQCILAAKVAHQEHLVASWEKLPSFFDLPSWDELCRMDFEG